MFAVVMATAAVTLAVGVTTAALSGYLAPRRGAPAQPTIVAPTTATERKDPPPSVVLVPVTEATPRPKRAPTVARRRLAPILAADHDDEREHDRVATADDRREHEDDDD